MKTKLDWIKLLNNSLNTATIETAPNFPYDMWNEDWEKFNQYIFARDFCKALLEHINLPNPGLSDKLVEHMNSNQLNDYSILNIRDKWNNSKHPIRNFLIVSHIDFPPES